MIVKSPIDLILGTAQLISSYGITRQGNSVPDRESAISLLETAFDGGAKTLDTAPAYGDAETVIGGSGLPFKVHTKLRSGRSAIDSLKQSKLALQVNEIDVVYIHDIDSFRMDPQKMIDDLSQLLDCGVLNIGVSIYDESDLELVHQFNQVSFVQVPMNVIDRRFSGTKMEELKASGRSVVVRSAFLQGVLLADPSTLRPQVRHLETYSRQLREVASNLGIDSMVACLHWLLSQRGISGIIVGSQNSQEFSAIEKSWTLAKSISLDPEWADCLQLPDSEFVDPRQWNVS